MRVSIPVRVLSAAVVLLAGCGPAPTPPGNAAEEPAANALQPGAPDPAPGPVKIEATTDLLEFSYAWPAEAAAIAPLDQWLRGNMDYRRTRMTNLAQSGAEQAREGGYPVRPYGFSQSWTTVADTPALLVLHAEGYEFTGGAHGMPFVATLVWDKAKAERLPLSALLDIPALTRIATARFCESLDAERAKKRGTPDRAAAGTSAIPEFDRCVDMAKQEIVPVAQGGEAIDTLRVEILPYEAGPYAEGTYVIDLPMDAAMLAAVKPAWKSAFAAK